MIRRTVAALVLAVGMITAPVGAVAQPLTFVRDIPPPGPADDIILEIVSFPAGSFGGVPYPAQHFLVSSNSGVVTFGGIYLLPARGSSAPPAVVVQFGPTDPPLNGRSRITGWLRPDGGREIVMTVGPRNVSRFDVELLQFTSNQPSVPLLIGTVSSMQVDSLGNGFVLKDDQIFSLNIATGASAALTTAGTGDGQLTGATALSLGPDGFLYALDLGNGRIQGFTLAGAYYRQFPLQPGVTNDPGQFAVASDGRFYVGDGSGGGSAYDTAGAFLGTFVTPGPPVNTRAALNNSLSVDPDGTVLMIDIERQNIHEFIPPASIDALIAKLLATSLSKKDIKAPLDRLKAAQKELDKNHNKPARKELEEFIKEVNKLVKSHKLAADQATGLILDAQSLIDSIPKK